MQSVKNSLNSGSTFDTNNMVKTKVFFFLLLFVFFLFFCFFSFCLFSSFFWREDKRSKNSLQWGGQPTARGPHTYGEKFLWDPPGP